MSKLFSDDYQVVAQELKKLIELDQMSDRKAFMLEGEKYYDYKHDILDLRLFYRDSKGEIREEKNRSNVKIAHPFFTELVDQKVQYLLSNAIKIETEDEALKDYLTDYIDEDFQVTLQELVEGAACKGREYLYTYINDDDRLSFAIADSKKVVEIFDNNRKRTHVVRYYDKKIESEHETKIVLCVELWDHEKVTFFAQSGEKLEFDKLREVNPKPHATAKTEDNVLLGRGLGYIPFFKLSNNRRETTDLQPIKAIIDDYDLMSGSLSNNLIDFDHPLYAVKGYPGDDLDDLVTNLKTRKTIGLDTDGSVDVKTVAIPIEARKAKIELDKEAIYKFGMGFDSTQTGDGNITNIVIKSRYSLLDLKCNKIEPRLRKIIREILRLIVNEINQKHGTGYDYRDLDITITRETMVNDSDEALREKTKAETLSVLISSIATVAPLLDEQSVLELICEQFDLSLEDVQKRLEEQDYSQGLSLGTDPESESQPA